MTVTATPTGAVPTQRQPAEAGAEALVRVLTRSIAHTYGLDGWAARAVALERVADFDRFMGGYASTVDVLGKAETAVRRTAAAARRLLRLGAGR